MTKTRTTSRRTDPLDRDGDGHPGGSLPGNETAPFAADVDDLADARTTPGGDEAKLAAIEREVDEAKAEAAQAATSEEEPGKAEDANEEQLPLLEPDDQVGASEDDGHADTFTPEEIASGQTPVIEAEGEQVATAADTAPAETLARVDLDTPPGDQPRTVAVRVDQLRLLVQNRWLYRCEHGYGAASGPPYVDQATIDVWIEAGLCVYSATAGNSGGVRVTHEGRRALVAQRAA